MQEFILLPNLPFIACFVLIAASIIEVRVVNLLRDLYQLIAPLPLIKCGCGILVGWEIWTEESAEHASVLIRQTVIKEKLTTHKHPLALLSDNGSPIKGAIMLETLYTLSITPSRSRPRVSNDNPYAESIFRTIKFHPSFPSKGFIDVTEARQWVLAH